MHLMNRIKQAGATGYILLWLLGIPIPILLLIFLLRSFTSCTTKIVPDAQSALLEILVILATGRCSVPDYSMSGRRSIFRSRGNLVKRKRSTAENNKRKKIQMKKLLLSMVLAVAAPFAWAQVSETTTTTTTTEGNGTITEYTPGNVIVLKESSGPRTYRFGKTVTYVTRSGKTLDEDVVRTRVKVGVPVRVHYVGTGDNMMVDRVILDED